MKTFLLALALLMSFFTMASAADPAPTLFHAGTGVPHILPTDTRNTIWSEPPDLNGLIGSSEQILRFGLETEIANDFIPSEPVMTRATFWGGYYNNSNPCDAGMEAPGFNFEFFDDAGCIPGQMIASLSITEFSEESMGCQAGVYPMFKWSAPALLTLVAGNRYWFCAQIKDHDFPPQGGRLAAGIIRGCDSMFRSVYFSYPDWTPAGGWDTPFDASQEFEGLSSDAEGACCLPLALCVLIRQADCVARGGTWQGEGTTCVNGTCAAGACCAVEGTCTVTTIAECRAPDFWQGAGTNCGSATCAPRDPGAITAWGDNDHDQCNVPPPDSAFVAVSAGQVHALGLRRDGTVAAWGYSYYGQINVPPLPPAVAVGAGGYHSLALLSDGSVAAWGYNYYHQCEVPAPDTGFVAIAAGGYHSIGLKRDGHVEAWGDNGAHQCDVPAPNTDFIAISAGGYHSLGLKRDGAIVAWGWNQQGQCDVPPPNTGFIAIAAGLDHSLGLKADGSIVAWGLNDSSQCNVPAPNTGFIAMAGGFEYSLGLKADGTVVTWGSNDHGQGRVPEPNRDFVAIAASSYYGTSYGLTRYPTVACCQRDGTCTVTAAEICASTGGMSEGAGSVCDANPCGPASAEAAGSSVALRLRASPNPSGGRTVIDYELPRATAAVLQIYDAAGRVVSRIPLGTHAAGRYTFRWDGWDAGGRILPAGVYLTRITTNDGARTGRLVIIDR